MRFFLLIVVAGYLFSCNKSKEQENVFSGNLSFSMDTVWVDSGDEFIYLQDNLSLSDLSSAKNYLINFNRMDNYAERINLDELVLEKKIQFEKEGPNGLGSIISNFRITPEGQLMVWFYKTYALFDQDAKKVRDLGLEKIAGSYLNGSETYPLMLFEDPAQPDRIVGVFIQWQDNTYFLLDFDLKNQDFKKTDLPELTKLRDYRVDILHEGRPAGSFGVALFPASTPDKIVIANNSINEVHVFDLKTDSLFIKSWDTPLLGDRKKYLPPKQVDHATGELENIYKKSKEEINFGRFIWDEELRRFLRFSARESFGEEKNEYGQYAPTGADVYLSIFDENLNLLAESPVQELNAPPKKHFVKDGKVWMYENIEDELAFVRLSME
ncbi:DUF4221 family protein [Negadavirga shengliensis]|uniref:DUF4221 family protein n=1 Tax=Negadavirga shengliensis TaxID=1389218 RepID=A0ABV9SZU0_9BACT